MKLIVKFLVMFLFVFIYFSKFDVVNAGSYDQCGTTGCGAGQVCDCPEGSYDWVNGHCMVQSQCMAVPIGQEPCDHTICPVGYRCNRNNAVSFCEKSSSTGTGGGQCGTPGAYGVNCPPGYTQGSTVVASGCYRPTYCPGPGTAQKYGGTCCQWEYYPDDCREVCQNGTCRNFCTPVEPSCLWYNLETYNCVPPATTIPVVTASPVPTVSPSPVPTATPTGQCSMTKIYTNGWVELTPAAFKGLTQGIQVYFCVNGVTNTSVFDSGRFTINGVVRPVTTVTRPGTNDFCDLYTIPANTYTFKVQGEIHHTVLGWL